MSRPTIAAVLVMSLWCSASDAAPDQGYFSDGNKKLVFMEEGNRTETEKITLYSIFGGAVLAGAIGTYYVLDSKSLSDELSSKGVHTGRAWTQRFEDKRESALRSRTIAQVSLGISAGLLLSGIVAFIITEPDEKAGYQDWQSTNSSAMPSFTFDDEAFVVRQGWTF